MCSDVIKAGYGLVTVILGERWSGEGGKKQREEKGEVLFLLEIHVSKEGGGEEGEEPEEGFLSYCQLRVPLIQM